ncbi:MAG TPA: sigma-70 family RNA polymerase sigma factor [Lacunisphaera sp.]|jgi:RNA polymerase sigma factor (sigma-70 family)
MTDDAELLHCYAKDRSESAFTELVRRHINLVYGAALRRAGGDAHRAADVVQLVFTELARKAASLKEHAVLTGWLYATTRNKAIDTLRSERRRQNRETEAQVMHESSSSGAADIDWARLRPVLDDVLDDLNNDEREAVLLRFFQELSFSEIGATLRVSEDAARMRVSRSLEKLRAALSRRGVTSTTAALTMALASQTGMAAPAGLVTIVTTTALAGAAVVGGSATVGFMSMTKLSIGLVTVVLAAGTLGLIRQHATNETLRTQNTELQQQNQELKRLRSENESLVKSQAAGKKEIAELQDEINGLLGEAKEWRNALRKQKGGGEVTAKAPVTRNTAALSVLQNRYAALARRLAFTPSQWDRFRILLAAKQTMAEDITAALLGQGLSPKNNLRTIRDAVADAQLPVDAQIKEEFGEAVLKEYKQYEQLLPQYNTVEKFTVMLSSTDSPLSDAQIGQLVQILDQTHEPEGNGSIGRILNGNINYHSKISAQTIKAASGLLNEFQLAELKRLQQLQLGKYNEDGSN